MQTTRIVTVVETPRKRTRWHAGMTTPATPADLSWLHRAAGKDDEDDVQPRRSMAWLQSFATDVSWLHKSTPAEEAAEPAQRRMLAWLTPYSQDLPWLHRHRIETLDDDAARRIGWHAGMLVAPVFADMLPWVRHGRADADDVADAQANRSRVPREVPSVAEFVLWRRPAAAAETDAEQGQRRTIAWFTSPVSAETLAWHRRSAIEAQDDDVQIRRTTVWMLMSKISQKRRNEGEGDDRRWAYERELRRQLAEEDEADIDAIMAGLRAFDMI